MIVPKLAVAPIELGTPLVQLPATDQFPSASTLQCEPPGVGEGSGDRAVPLKTVPPGASMKRLPALIEGNVVSLGSSVTLYTPRFVLMNTSNRDALSALGRANIP